MPKRPNIIENERVDLPDLNSGFKGFTENESNFRDKKVSTSTPKVLTGFQVRIDSAAGRLITVFNGVAFNKDGQLISEETAPNVSRQVQLPNSDGIYYIEIEFTKADSDVDARAGWDQTAGVSGSEYTQNIPTRVTPDWRIVSPASTLGFSEAAGRVPIAQIEIVGGVVANSDLSVPVSAVGDKFGSTQVEVFDARAFLLTTPNTYRFVHSGGTFNDIAVTAIDYDSNRLTVSPSNAAIVEGDIVVLNNATSNILTDAGSGTKVVAPKFWMTDLTRGGALRRTPDESNYDLPDSFTNVRNLKDFVDAIGYAVNQFNVEHFDSDGTHRIITGDSGVSTPFIDIGPLNRTSSEGDVLIRRDLTTPGNLAVIQMGDDPLADGSWRIFANATNKTLFFKHANIVAGYNVAFSDTGKITTQDEIKTLSGNVESAENVIAENDIISNTGTVKAIAGNVEAAGNIIATAGNIITTAGDFKYGSTQQGYFTAGPQDLQDVRTASVFPWSYFNIFPNGSSTMAGVEAVVNYPVTGSTYYATLVCPIRVPDGAVFTDFRIAAACDVTNSSVPYPQVGVYIYKQAIDGVTLTRSQVNSAGVVFTGWGVLNPGFQSFDYAFSSSEIVNHAAYMYYLQIEAAFRIDSVTSEAATALVHYLRVGYTFDTLKQT